MASSTSDDVVIRQVRQRDAGAVDDVIDRAFLRPAVTRFVHHLRDGMAIRELSFLADVAGAVAGVVMLSPLEVEGESGWTVLNLTPLAVDPRHQRKGVGRALVRHALAAAAAWGAPAVVLEGDPAVYSRLGFERASARGILRPSDLIPDAAFQVCLLPAYDPSVHHGRVVYPASFFEMGVVGPADA